jgi:ATP-dependent helicase/nuclease subunit A
VVDIDLSADARQRWHELHLASLAAASMRGYVTATQLKASERVTPLAKEPSPEAVDEPWRRGRGALALGRAVHGVLQFAALDGSDVDRLAAEQALAHDLGKENAPKVAELARKTLACPAVAAARGRRAWRELWVAAPLIEGVAAESTDVPTIEGAIDLIYETDEGSLVVVDYKTDRVEGSTLESKAQPYVLQLGAYAWAVEKLTGRSVSKAVLVFSSEAAEGRPAEFEVPDLRSAMNAAREAALLAVGLPAGR